MSSQAFPETRSFDAMGVAVVVGGATERTFVETARLFRG
jgi:hypothetical protein